MLQGSRASIFLPTPPPRSVQVVEAGVVAQPRAIVRVQLFDARPVRDLIRRPPPNRAASVRVEGADLVTREPDEAQPREQQAGVRPCGDD